MLCRVYLKKFKNERKKEEGEVDTECIRKQLRIKKLLSAVA